MGGPEPAAEPPQELPRPDDVATMLASPVLADRLRDPPQAEPAEPTRPPCTTASGAAQERAARSTLPSLGRSGPTRPAQSSARLAQATGRGLDFARRVEEAMSISRGFRGRRDRTAGGRLPPGQYLVRDFPVLSAGPTPRTPLADWTFSVTGEIEESRQWTWEA